MREIIETRLPLCNCNACSNVGRMASPMLIAYPAAIQSCTRYSPWIHSWLGQLSCVHSGQNIAHIIMLFPCLVWMPLAYYKMMTCAMGLNTRSLQRKATFTTGSWGRQQLRAASAFKDALCHVQLLPLSIQARSLWFPFKCCFQLVTVS